eukprot:COSAG02_NODE_1229_length_13775_cov_35.321512_8_plen_81_part_00
MVSRRVALRRATQAMLPAHTKERLKRHRMGGRAQRSKGARWVAESNHRTRGCAHTLVLDYMPINLVKNRRKIDLKTEPIN